MNKPIHYQYLYVSTLHQAKKICEYIRKASPTVLAFDLEGVNLGLKGQATLLQVAIDETIVFCFDLLNLGHTVLGPNYLGPFFTASSIHKLCFDCRVDGEVLSAHFGLPLQGLLDIQILYTLLFQGKNDRYLKGLRHVLEYSGIIASKQQLHTLLVAKFHVKNLMASNPYLFKERPLTPQILHYCAADVVLLLRMYAHWQNCYSPHLIVHISMARLHRFRNRNTEIPPREMSVLDFSLTALPPLPYASLKQSETDSSRPLSIGDTQSASIRMPTTVKQ